MNVKAKCMQKKKKKNEMFLENIKERRKKEM